MRWRGVGQATLSHGGFSGRSDGGQATLSQGGFPGRVTNSSRTPRGQSCLSPSAPIVAILTLLLATVLLSGCGYIGAPLAPALDIPTRVTDLRAIEYGENIVAQFTLPPLTTEGLPLKTVESVDLYIGAFTAPFNQNAWAASARPFPVHATAPGALTHPIPAREWIGKDVFLGVRAKGPKGKVSDWSNLVQLHVETPLRMPTSLALKNVAKGVQVSWNGSE
jgi:hypothetical protein